MADHGMMCRRSLLRLFGYGTLIWAVGAKNVWGRQSVPAQSAWRPIARKLSTLFEQPLSARSIGAAYLQGAPAEAEPQRLLALLGGTPEASADLMRASTEELRSRFRRQRREDFARGQTVLVRGWMLSATEARLCALTCLV
jgi:hypothetical protein